jgi:hypothetical protein
MEIKVKRREEVQFTRLRFEAVEKDEQYGEETRVVIQQSRGVVGLEWK